jgi:FixJ family two-component response regulator
LSDSDIITIIDDDPSVRLATGRLVRSLGWPAHTFASSEEFLESPQLAQTRCVVSDVQMPGVDGLELQRRLASQGHLIPIIFMTAFPHEVVRERAMAGGAVRFLAKPLDASTLSDCINVALARYRQK